jgi:hypothetical protein
MARAGWRYTPRYRRPATDLTTSYNVRLSYESRRDQQLLLDALTSEERTSRVRTRAGKAEAYTASAGFAGQMALVVRTP